MTPPITNAEKVACILSARQEPGLVLVSIRPPGRILCLNARARDILEQAESHKPLAYVRSWLRSHKKAVQSDDVLAVSLAWTFPSGRRRYALRGLWLRGRGAPPILALLLERMNPRRLELERCRTQYHLSGRELDVVIALSEGRTDKQIAAALGVGAETVRGHLKSVRAKLDVSTRTAILHKISELSR